MLHDFRAGLSAAYNDNPLSQRPRSILQISGCMHYGPIAIPAREPISALRHRGLQAGAQNNVSRSHAMFTSSYDETLLVTGDVMHLIAELQTGEAVGNPTKILVEFHAG